MCGAEIASMSAYAGYAAQLPSLSAHWALSPAQAGWISGGFYAGYAVAVPILVTLTDRTGPRAIYLPSMFMGALCALGFAFLADGFWTALLLHGAMGAALAGTYMPGLRLLTDRLSGAAQSRAVVLYTSCYAVGAAVSFAAVGLLSQAMNWRWVFAIAAAGPALALAAVLVGAGPSAPDRPRDRSANAFDFRPVLRDGRVMARSVAYGAHNFELFGLWSWSVAALTFAYQLRPSDGGQVQPALVAALLTLLLLPASFLGNEIAMRVGRRAFIIAAMSCSAMAAMAVGTWIGTAPPAILVCLMLIYGVVVAAESGALTASVIQTTPPETRGKAMAVYSTVGFAGAFAGPLAFGLALDIGGATSPRGWTAAFAVLGAGVLCGPIALLAFDRRRGDRGFASDAGGSGADRGTTHD